MTFNPLILLKVYRLLTLRRHVFAFFAVAKERARA
jgi:hypothetical protein